MAEDVADEERQRHARQVTEERRRARFLEQAERAARELDADPDADGLARARGALGESVAELGEGLPDRLVLARDRHLVPQPPSLPVRTERLLLRVPRMDDVEAMFGWYADEEVARYLLSPALCREELEVQLLRRTGRGDEGPKPDVLPLVIELDGRVVGDLVLMLRGPSYSAGEIGWTLDPAVGGRGIATEAARALLAIAFGHYRLHRVYAELDARNTASRALCERIGMRREAHGLRDYWSKGEWTDSYRYAMLREEYAAATG